MSDVLREVRVLVVGRGHAAAQHLEAMDHLRRIGPSIAQPIGFVDIDLTQSSLIQGVDLPVFQTLEHALSQVEFDAVAICTPPGSHACIALNALEHRKAVLIEKPITINEAELDDIVAAASKSGLPALGMLQHRARIPPAAQVTAWGEGSGASIEVIRSRQAAHYTSAAWRTDHQLAGGGFVAHLAVHYIDLACQLLGRVEHVEGIVDCRDFIGIDTRATLAVKFHSGATLAILASAHIERHDERLHLFDASRSLTIDNRRTIFESQHDRNELISPKALELRAEVYRELQSSLCGAVSRGKFDIRTADGVTTILSAVRLMATNAKADQ